jgi:Tol biopolymer transport system component
LSRTTKLVLLSSLLLPLLNPDTAWAGRVELISRAAPDGLPQAAGKATGAVISADGRWIAFASSAPDLVPGQIDGNNANDVFLADRTTGALTLVSHAAGSAVQAGNGTSSPPKAISADGRYVAYVSQSSNLIAGQNASAFYFDVFLWDRVTGSTVLVSHAPGSSVQGTSVSSLAGMSDDGRYVAFLSRSASLIAGGADANSRDDLFLWDRTTGGLTLVSHAAGSALTAGDGATSAASLSGDGRWIAFASQSGDMVTGGTDTNSQDDAFLWDRTTGTVTLISHVDGNPLAAPPVNSGFPVISRDGDWVAFSGLAQNLLPGSPASPDGTWDYFVLERATGALTLITHAPGSPAVPVGGASTGLAVSDDGSWVVFGDSSNSMVSGQVDSNNNIDVFLWERATGTNRLVSHGTAGPATAGNAGSLFSWIAADGSRVAFWSLATDLVAGGTDSNGTDDAFAWDRATGAITLISHATASPVTAGNGQSTVSGMSADGNFVAFESAASDLNPSDTNGGSDIFLWDRAAGTSAALSLSPAAVSSTPDQGVWFVLPHMLSADGRFAVFLSASSRVVPGQTDTNGVRDVFLVDRSTGITTLVSHSTASPTTAGNRECQDITISADGEWVAFSSGATDLVSGFTPAPSSHLEMFLWNRLTGTTVLASHSPSSPTTGSCFFCTLPSLSADGRFLAFATFGLSLYDRVTGTKLTINPGTTYDPRISTDGQFVAFVSNASLPGQTGPNAYNVYLYDRAAATTTLVSHASASPAQRSMGCQPFRPDISADGRYVAYQCEAADLVAGQADTNGGRDVFLYDRTTGLNTLISHSAGSPATAGNSESFLPWLSADGRRLAFSSAASDLLNGITDTNNAYDAFLFDRITGATTLLSHKASAPVETPAGRSYALGLSPGGETVAVLSAAADLMTGITDLNATDDLFLIEPATGAVELMSRTPAGPAVTGNGAAYFYPSFSADGSVVLFPSYASDLVAGDRNLSLDVFVYLLGLDYYTLTPCRLFDTRQPPDGPALASGATVSLQPLGLCGIPPTARALSLNLTVLGGTGSGHLLLFPGGTTAPGTSAINFSAGATRANNAIFSLGGDGSLDVMPFVTGNGTVHVILDVTGYFQ